MMANASRGPGSDRGLSVKQQYLLGFLLMFVTVSSCIIYPFYKNSSHVYYTQPTRVQHIRPRPMTVRNSASSGSSSGGTSTSNAAPGVRTKDSIFEVDEITDEQVSALVAAQQPPPQHGSSSSSTGSPSCRLVAIGDLHGDLLTGLRLLIETRLISKVPHKVPHGQPYLGDGDVPARDTIAFNRALRWAFLNIEALIASNATTAGTSTDSGTPPFTIPLFNGTSGNGRELNSVDNNNGKFITAVDKETWLPQWIGGCATLIQTGDLLDRGPHGRVLVTLFSLLSRQAAQSHGRVHVMLGNHEVLNLMGDTRFVSRDEIATTPGGLQSYMNSFTKGTGDTWRLLQHHPVAAALRNSRLFFVHAGLNLVMASFGANSLKKGLNAAKQEAADLQTNPLLSAGPGSDSRSSSSASPDTTSSSSSSSSKSSSKFVPPSPKRKRNNNNDVDGDGVTGMYPIPDFNNGAIDALNRVSWYQMATGALNTAIFGEDGVIWNREMLMDASEGRCDEVRIILTALSSFHGTSHNKLHSEAERRRRDYEGAAEWERLNDEKEAAATATTTAAAPEAPYVPRARMIVGHTIHEKVTAYCGGDLIAIDVGNARFSIADQEEASEEVGVVATDGRSTADSGFMGAWGSGGSSSANSSSSNSGMKRSTRRAAALEIMPNNDVLAHYV